MHTTSLPNLAAAAKAVTLASLLAATPLAAQEKGDAGMMKDHAMATSNDAMASASGKLSAAEGRPAGSFEVTGAGAKRRLKLGADFAVPSEPDLYVVLARETAVAHGDVYLGRLKQTTGASEYAVPEKIDLAAYPHLIIWSKSRAAGVAEGTVGEHGMMQHDAMHHDAMSKDQMGKETMKKGDMAHDGSMEKMGPAKGDSSMHR